MNWTLLLIGTHVLCFIVGGIFAFIIFCVCMAAGDEDRRMEKGMSEEDDGDDL